MNNFSLPSVLHSFVFLSDSIFLGLKFLIPVIFLITIFRVRVKRLKLATLIIAANVLLSAGGILFLITIGTDIFNAWYTGNEFEQNFIISLVTGTHWFQFIIPAFNYGLLPNVMWISKLRSTVYSTFAIVGCWYISYFLIDYLTRKLEFIESQHASRAEFPIAEYSEKGIIFAALLTITYLILRKKHHQPVEENKDREL